MTDSVRKIGVFNAFLALVFAGESQFSYLCVYWYRLGRRWADRIREQQGLFKAIGYTEIHGAGSNSP